MNAPLHFEVYFDFDNTVTPFDVLDDIIQRFSIDDTWKIAEEKWETGLIGSKECLEQQIALVRATQAQLEDYTRSISIDPAFPAILDLLRARGVETKILSDSFVEIIERILAHNGVFDLPVLANSITIEGDRWKAAFPYHKSICSTCANCKTSHLMKRGRPALSKKIYIGDGRSDICPAGFCEIIFCKGTLYQHYKTLRPACIEFHALGSVYTELKSILK